MTKLYFTNEQIRKYVNGYPETVYNYSTKKMDLVLTYSWMPTAKEPIVFFDNRNSILLRLINTYFYGEDTVNDYIYKAKAFKIINLDDIKKFKWFYSLLNKLTFLLFNNQISYVNKSQYNVYKHCLERFNEDYVLKNDGYFYLRKKYFKLSGMAYKKRPGLTKDAIKYYFKKFRLKHNL